MIGSITIKIIGLTSLIVCCIFIVVGFAIKKIRKDESYKTPLMAGCTGCVIGLGFGVILAVMNSGGV